MGKGRAPCCDKTKVRSGPWSPAEDFRLITFIQKHGHPNWRALPKQSGLLRCGKSCRLRWINYLRPDVKRGNFTPQEEQTIINLHNSIGNKWSKIAASLPGRTDNEIKNVWNTFLKKRALSTTMMDYPNTESNDSTVNALASSSSTASSSLTTDDQIMEKLPSKDDDRVPVHRNQTMVSEHSESPDRTGSNNVSDHWSILQQDDMHTPEEELGFLELENNIPLQHESDVIDFWEFVDSMEMNELEEQQQACSKDDTTNNSSPGNYSSTSEVEFSKWLTNIEEELGLKSDGEHLTSGGLLPEICGDSDNQSCYNYCPELWPSSPLYFGI